MTLHASSEKTSHGAALLDFVEKLRLDASRRIADQTKAEKGQFFTPTSVAQLMASCLDCRDPVIHILDAGAGVGSLFAASVAELAGRRCRPRKIIVTAYKTDDMLCTYLTEPDRGNSQVGANG
jgi:adenine-specific DNA-methyltransferase